MRRAQTSVEYIFILAAILIVIGAYLASTGRFGDIISKPDRSEYWLTTPIGITGVAYGNKTTITIINNNPYDINLTLANMTIDGDQINFSDEGVLIKSQTQLKLDAPERICNDPAAILFATFHFEFKNMITGRTELFIPERNMQLYCNN